MSDNKTRDTEKKPQELSEKEADQVAGGAIARPGTVYDKPTVKFE
jgi:hypothetical protein